MAAQAGGTTILAADVGGTSARLAFFEVNAGGLTPIAEREYPSQKHAGLDEIVRAFVEARRLPVQHACFGIAGPVENGRVRTPNLPWVVDGKQLAKQLGLKTVAVINDLEANAHGIMALESKDFAVINEGAPDAAGNAAVIAAGTGLGEAGVYWDGKNHHPFACEGGHADLAARNDLEAELFLYLRKKRGHVSFERVLSGPGLHGLYEFLRDTGRGQESASIRDLMGRQDPSAVISQAALEGTCELCSQALDLFISFYGAEAGNLALKMMATGGVYVGGGIAPKIIKRLKGPGFMEAFTAKGRMKSLLEAIPVRVILNDRTALLGAARCAALRASLLDRDGSEAKGR
jgi:glucokinase